jgi:hypothetical protein
MYTISNLGFLKGKDHLLNLGVDGKVGKVWTGWNWLRTGTSGGPL